MKKTFRKIMSLVLAMLIVSHTWIPVMSHAEGEEENNSNTTEIEVVTVVVPTEETLPEGNTENVPAQQENTESQPEPAPVMES